MMATPYEYFGSGRPPWGLDYTVSGHAHAARVTASAVPLRMEGYGYLLSTVFLPDVFVSLNTETENMPFMSG